MRYPNPLLFFGIIIIIFVFRTWFFDFGFITHGDWYFYFADNITELRIISIFNPNNLGYGEALVNLKPILILMSLLGEMSLHMGILTRVVYTIPALLSAYLGTYLWIKMKSDNQLLGFVGAMYMVFNTYMLIISTGHLTLYAAISFIPLAFYFYDKHIDHQQILHRNMYLYFHFITSLLISFYEIRIFIIYIALFGLYLLWHFDFRLKAFVTKGTISIIGILLVNIFWILPLLLMNTSAYDSFHSRDIFGDQFLNMPYALSITHPFWTLNGPVPFHNSAIIFAYWLTPFTIITLVWLAANNIRNKSNRVHYIYLFAILYLIGVFLTKQSGIPFPKTYHWLFTNIPYFTIYREASKFFAISVISFIGVLSYFPKKYYNKKLSYILLGLLLSSIMINTVPLITGEIGGVHKTTDLPVKYSNINQVIQNDGGQFNTVLIPTFSRWSYYNNDKPRISFSDLAIHYKNQHQSVNRRDFEIITQDEFIQLLTEADIKYVITMDDKEFDNEGDTAIIRTLSLDRPDAYTTVLSDADYLVLRNNYYGTNNIINLTRESFNLYRINMINEYNTFDMPVKYDPNWKITTNTSLTETVLRKNWVNSAVSRSNSNGLQEFIVPASPDLPNQLYIQYVPDAYHKVGFILSGIFFVLVSVIILLPLKNRIELVK